MFIMKYLKYILLSIMLLQSVSCTEFQLATEKSSVPVITSLFSEPGTDNVTLTSSISNPSTRVQCGFYIGKDKKTLTQYKCELKGNTFSLVVSDLKSECGYWYKAYVTNGINEICTNLQNFETLPKKELTVNFDGDIIVNTKTLESLIELKVNLTGNCDQIKNMWFIIGYSADSQITKVNAEISNNVMKGYAIELKAGRYLAQAYISDGITTKESEPVQFDIVDSRPPLPPGSPEFDAEVNNISVSENENSITFKAIVSGNFELVKETWFCIGDSPYDIHLQTNAKLQGTEMTGAMSKPAPGKYWAKACISDGKITHESEVFQFEIKAPPTPEQPYPPKPEVDFTTEIAEVYVSKSGDLIEFTAWITGDATLIKEGYFYIGLTEEHMLRISTGKIEENKMRAFVAGLNPGRYKYKASITDGIEVKESPLQEIEIN